MMFSEHFKKIILSIFIILTVHSFTYASDQVPIVETPATGTAMYLKVEYRALNAGQQVVFLRDLKNGEYLTSLGPIKRSLLETVLERQQRLQSVTLNADQLGFVLGEYRLIINNAAGCTVEFSPPHENLSYVANMSLEPGEYDIRVSKRLYFPLSLRINLKKSVSYKLKWDSIFTNYAGGHIDKLIKRGEIGLDEEFEGKTLLHQLVDHFSEEYPSFARIGHTYHGPPENAPLDDLLNTLKYFIINGFDINKPDSHGKNLLSNVMNEAPAEVVSLLFEYGAKVQPEFKDVGNYSSREVVTWDYGEKWEEQVLHLFPAELLTEILDHKVDGFFPATDHQIIKLLVEGGAYPFDAFKRSDKQRKARISGRIAFVMGEQESYSYLKWATENYEKIKQWKEKQQLSFKLNRGEFTEIKEYVSLHPNSIQYITDEKLKTFLIGSTGLPVKEIADRIAQGSSDDELVTQISGTETEYVDAFTAEQKQYMLDAGLTPSLISFLEEHTRQVKNIKEERTMLAMLQQEEERRAAEAAARAAESKRQARIVAQRRAEAEKRKQNGELFGKILALGAGAVIANSSSLDSGKKAEFLTNYSTDVLTNNQSMSNTKQWANATGSQSAQTGSSGGVTNEAARNKQISSSCRQQSNGYDDGDGQTTSHCRTAIYNKCVADGLCSLYPSKCNALRARVTTSCDIMSKMGFNGCPACN